MSKKWRCDWCDHSFRLKRELIDHLNDESTEAWQMASIVDGQLEDLGVINA